MKKVAKVSELKASLSKYLARVKAGEEVVVTERGKPIANEDSQTERMNQLARRGVITLPKGRLPEDFFDLPRPDDPEGLVLKALLDERRTGR